MLNFRGFFYVQMERRVFSFSGASSSPIRRLESFEEPKKEVSLLELQAESWYNSLGKYQIQSEKKSSPE